jgi:ATP/maltotriose-dependent transcriptional regulator MalT
MPFCAPVRGPRDFFGVATPSGVNFSRGDEGIPAVGLLRARITEHLTRASQYPVTLIVAPAGFGKSVALRDFLAETRIETLRYDVPREDASLEAFVRGLARTIEPVVPDAVAALPSVQRSAFATQSPAPVLADWFAEQISRASCTIVIDDLHHAVADAACTELIVRLIQATTGSVKWILSTRSDTGLPVASWIAYGMLDVLIGEDELRFDAGEASALAEASGTSIDRGGVEALRDLCGGWPVALTIALRTRTYASDLYTATSGARDMLYRYLAEQIFAACAPEQRAFLLASCVVPFFDVHVAEGLGGTRALVERLRAHTGLVTEFSPGRFRYHDLFRDFLEIELQRAGNDRWIDALVRAANVVEARGDVARSLSLRVRANEVDGMLEILRRHGTALFDGGASDALAPALAAIAHDPRSSCPRVLGVKAMLEASRGHFELAQQDFIDAIERSDDEETRLTLVHRYAIELIRRERDARALLEPYARDNRLPARLRVPILGTYATALALVQRLDEAMSTIAQGVAAIDGSVGDDVRARFYQQAAYVHHLHPTRGDAWNYALLAVDLAQTRGLDDVAARAYSALYTILYDDEDDPAESLEMLARLIDCARKSGNVQTRLFGLIASYEIQVERGDDAAIEALEREISFTGSVLPRTQAETLLPARALRAAWDGNMAVAYEVLKDAPLANAAAERRALRAAEIALYAVAAGHLQEGEEAERQARAALHDAPAQTRRGIRTRLMLALCDLLRGRLGSAHRFISEAERASSVSRRLRSLTQAVRILYRRALGQCTDDDVGVAYERLRVSHFGGIARLLQLLEFPGALEEGGYAALTTAEREILAALALGATSKEIAARSDRSAQTIDTHVRSICRKLRCNGRREAVALALRSGWVQG